jgi:hypothetical protein
VLTVAAQVGSPDWSKPRDLPSLVVRWTRAQGACALLAQGDAVFALEPRRVVALHAHTGNVRWERALDTDDCPYWWQYPLVIERGRLAAAAGDRVYVFALETGEPLGTVGLPGRFSTLWGPPLLASVAGEDSDTLLSIDIENARVLGRYTTHGDLYDLAHDDTNAIVHTAPDRLTALRLPQLAWSWTAEGFSGVGRVERQFFAGRRTKECDCEESAHPIDPATGKVDVARFQRAGRDSSARDRWDLELVESDDKSSTTVLRRAGSDGSVIWSRTVPAPVGAWSVEGETLLLAGETGGRNVLARFDWRTGDLLTNAYGVRGLISVTRSEDGLTLLTTDNVVNVADIPGPPESTTVSIKVAATEILAGQIDMWSDARERAVEIEQLGPEVLPILVDMAREAKGWPLAIAAWCLGAADHAPAGPVLASRLVRHDDLADPRTVDLALLGALARVGTDGETNAVIDVLHDASRADDVRFQAFVTLVNIGSPAAIGAADRALMNRRHSTRASFAPSAQNFLHLIGRPVDEEARNNAAEREDFEEWERLGEGGSAARVSLPSGDSLVVFRSSRLGRETDLWLEEFDLRGRPKTAAMFLGIAAPGAPCSGDPCPITIAIDGETLHVSNTGENAVSLSVDLRAVRRDSDGDGITDLVEQRIGTKPMDTDSDGDGIADAADAFPTSASIAMDEERARITQEILEQYHLLAGERDELAVLVGDLTPERSGRSGPTLRLTRREAETFKEGGGLGMLPLITVEPIHAYSGPAGRIAAFTHAGATPMPATGPDDRAYTVTIYRGPLRAVGYNVVVRKHGDRWRIRHFDQAWIS